MTRLDTKYLFLASLMLCIGVSLGIYMGATQDFMLRPVHAHVNLMGWASLALFGLTYRSYPDLAARWPAKIQFALVVPAVLLFPLGIYIAMTRHSETVVMVAGMAFAAGVLLFLGQMAALAFGRQRPAA